MSRREKFNRAMDHLAGILFILAVVAFGIGMFLYPHVKIKADPAPRPCLTAPQLGNFNNCATLDPSQINDQRK